MSQSISAAAENQLSGLNSSLYDIERTRWSLEVDRTPASRRREVLSSRCFLSCAV